MLPKEVYNKILENRAEDARTADVREAVNAIYKYLVEGIEWGRIVLVLSFRAEEDMKIVIINSGNKSYQVWNDSEGKLHTREVQYYNPLTPPNSDRPVAQIIIKDGEVEEKRQVKFKHNFISRNWSTEIDDVDIRFSVISSEQLYSRYGKDTTEKMELINWVAKHVEAYREFVEKLDWTAPED